MGICKLAFRALNNPTYSCVMQVMWATVYSQALAPTHTKQSSSTGKQFINEHCIVPKDLNRHFSVLKKCMNKFECLSNKQSYLRNFAYLIKKCVKLERIF